MKLADQPPATFVDALLPTMFSTAIADETMDAFRASMHAFHPRGFRAMARASAEDVRDVLPGISVLEAPAEFNATVRNFLLEGRNRARAAAGSAGSASRVEAWATPHPVGR